VSELPDPGVRARPMHHAVRPRETRGSRRKAESRRARRRARASLGTSARSGRVTGNRRLPRARHRSAADLCALIRRFGRPAGRLSSRKAREEHKGGGGIAGIGIPHRGNPPGPAGRPCPQRLRRIQPELLLMAGPCARLCVGPPRAPRLRVSRPLQLPQAPTMCLAHPLHALWVTTTKS
jgi:hypothetical protein